jgi:RNA polymerase sigma factor (sigma-70 family)
MPARPLLAAVLRLAPDGPPDRDLLARFARDRDEDAFAELVRRHGPMVLAVGRRVTGNPEDAEDAFQAAFLVLARRAGQVSRPDLLGNWLYGVAYRTALEARKARRRVKEQAVPDAPEPVARDDRPADHDPADLRRVIDEELAALPEKYRAAVVLCELQGLGRKEAAARLGIPEGTLSSRLAHARKVLAARLGRRGFAATAGAVAAAFGPAAGGSAVPHPLVVLTARAAARFAAGGAVPPALLPDRVFSLTDGVLKAMIVTRLRLIAGAAVVGLGVLGLGTAATLAQRPAPAPAAANPLADDEEVAAAQQPPAKGKAAGKAKAPEKVAAKGVEDDDVPYPSVPAQAVVRLEDGKIVVRQRARAGGLVYTAQADDGPPLASVAQGPRVVGHKYDASDVSVFDMKGNRVPTKAWKEKLGGDVHALIAFDGRLPHPRELTLFRDDVLLIVFPAGTGAPGHGFYPATVSGQYGPALWEAAPVAPATVPAQGGAASAPSAVTPGQAAPKRP